MKLIKHLCHALSDIVFSIFLEAYLSCPPGKHQLPIKICLPVQRTECDLRGWGTQGAGEGPWDVGWQFGHIPVRCWPETPFTEMETEADCCFWSRWPNHCTIIEVKALLSSSILKKSDSCLLFSRNSIHCLHTVTSGLKGLLVSFTLISQSVLIDYFYQYLVNVMHFFEEVDHGME